MTPDQIIRLADLLQSIQNKTQIARILLAEQHHEYIYTSLESIYDSVHEMIKEFCIERESSEVNWSEFQKDKLEPLLPPQ